MDRRVFLAGTTGILTLLTGCISNSPSGQTDSTPLSNPTQQPTPTGTGEPTTLRENSRTETGSTTNGSATDSPDDPYFEINSTYSEPQKIVAITHQGRVEKSNTTQRSPASYDTIRIWNNNTDSKTVEITIRVKDRPANPLSQETYTGNSPDNPIVQETYTIKPDAFITLRLLKPGTYEVKLKVDKQTIETIEYLTDNCNGQSLKIAIAPNGSIKSTAISTTMACIRSTTSEINSDT
jgi:hypothetical protein